MIDSSAYNYGMQLRHWWFQKIEDSYSIPEGDSTDDDDKATVA
jgi:hypothetical protein